MNAAEKCSTCGLWLSLIDLPMTLNIHPSQLDGVDAALDKWKGREEKMFDVLNKKYDKEIKAYWEREKEKYAQEDYKGEL